METRISGFPGATIPALRAAAAVVAAAAIACWCAGCGLVKPAEPQLKCACYSSAAVVSFPDGGTLLIDIGQGVTPEVMHATRQALTGADLVYRAFSLLQWRPRIDWIILAPDQGIWDYRFIDIINSFDVGGIYFPYNVRAGTVEPKMTRMLLQVALSGFPVYDLTRDRIDLYQSAAGARIRQFLPDPQATAALDKDEKAAVCLRIDYGKTSILIASRLSVRQEEDLVSRAGDALKSAVFYHPAATTPAFLAAVNPSWDITASTTVITISTNGERVRREATHE